MGKFTIINFTQKNIKLKACLAQSGLNDNDFKSDHIFGFAEEKKLLDILYFIIIRLFIFTFAKSDKIVYF